MATKVIDDDEDFITCGVCSYRYDLVYRKPKFLQCSHTVCLSCVKALFTECKINCPYCRHSFRTQDPNKLPNNNYAMQLLKLMGKSKETSSETSPRKIASMRWCSNCRSAGNSRCAVSGHLMISVSLEDVKQMEDMIQMKTELMKLKDQAIDFLPQIIQKRNLLQARLILWKEDCQTCPALQNVELEKLRDENDLILAEFTSILECNKRSGSLLSPEEKDDLLAFQLMSMIEDFCTDDTMETLKCKMEKVLKHYTNALHGCREEIKEVTTTLVSLQTHVKNSVILNEKNQRPTSYYKKFKA